MILSESVSGAGTLDSPVSERITCLGFLFLKYNIENIIIDKIMMKPMI